MHRIERGRTRGAAAAVATAVLVAGCVGQTPTPSSGASAQQTATSTPGATLALDRTFTSALYGYAVRYPSGFDPRSATEPLRGAAVPILDGAAVDQLTSPTLGIVVLASAALPKNVDDLDGWTAVTARGFCGTPTSSESITIGDTTGTLDTFATCHGYFHQWLTIVRDGLGYHMIWAHERGTESADRSLFLAMVRTFEFGEPPASPTATPSGVPVGMRPIEPGDPIPDGLLGPWSHSSGGFLWFLRAGDPACLDRPRTVQDCALWQSAGRPVESAIVAVVDGRLEVQWIQGGCAGRAIYSFGLREDGLTMRLVGGCQSGDFVLICAGSAGAPSAPPPPSP